MGKKSVKDDVRFAFEFAAIYAVRNHLGRVRMQIISGVFTEDQRMAPRAKIRLQILHGLASFFVDQMIMQLSRSAGERLFRIEFQLEARALDSPDEFIVNQFIRLKPSLR